MFRLFITRRVYGLLVYRYPAFMAIDWLKFTRNWTVDGCEVTIDNEAYHHALKCCVANVD